MITAHKQYLEAHCRERGYSWEEVQPCIVAVNGDEVTVDETHPAYPRLKRPPPPPAVFEAAPEQRREPPPPPLGRGPGTELKKLLKTWLKIDASPTCSCNARARRMDEEEDRRPGWCEAHIDEIVGWLREEAARRKLPFVDVAGRLLVRRAIKNARREAYRGEAVAPPVHNAEG